LQPIRLEKLLSRDSAYLDNYPQTLPAICKAYVDDLEKEDQLIGDEDMINSLKKSLGRVIYMFVKTVVNDKLKSC
jgi:hypothetical protein